MQLLFLGGGLWIIPLLSFLGASIFMYQSYKASKSGSEQLDSSVKGKGWQSDKNIPIHKTGGKFYFAVALYVATIVFIWVMWSDR